MTSPAMASSTLATGSSSSSSGNVFPSLLLSPKPWGCASAFACAPLSSSAPAPLRATPVVVSTSSAPVGGFSCQRFLRRDLHPHRTSHRQLSLLNSPAAPSRPPPCCWRPTHRVHLHHSTECILEHHWGGECVWGILSFSTQSTRARMHSSPRVPFPRATRPCTGSDSEDLPHPLSWNGASFPFQEGSHSSALPHPHHIPHPSRQQHRTLHSHGFTSVSAMLGPLSASQREPCAVPETPGCCSQKDVEGPGLRGGGPSASGPHLLQGPWTVARPLAEALGRPLALALGLALSFALAFPAMATAQAKKEAQSSVAAAATAERGKGIDVAKALAAVDGTSSAAADTSKAASAAQTKEASEKHAAAVEMLESFLKKHPDDIEALKMLLRVRLKATEFKAGLQVLESLRALQPQEREWRYLRAQILDYAGDLLAARQGFEEILEQEPFSARALQGLASVMRQSGEDSLVLGMVEAAVRKAEEEKRAAEVTNLKLLLGQLHATQGNVNAALAQYDAVIQENPRDFRPYLCKGLVLSLAGEGEQADQLFREFRQRCPKAYAPYLDNVIVRSSLESQRQQREEKAITAQGSKLRPARAMKQPKNS